MSNQRPPSINVVLVLSLLLVVSLFSGQTMGQKKPQQSAGCEREVVSDYFAALRKAEPIHQVPASGTLPFAPEGMRLFRIGGGPTIGPSAIGFSLSDFATDRQRHLDWVVQTTLTTVSPNGRAIEIMGRKVDRISKRNFEESRNGKQRFAVSASPADYRVDIRFESFAGSRLGEYSEYFRVMKPKYNSRLVLADRLVNPGQTVKVKFENRGTEMVGAELKVLIQGFDGNNWIRLGAVYPGGRVFDGRTYVYGGESGPCFVYRVPSEVLDQGFRRFRVSEQVRRFIPGPGPRRKAAVEFHIGGA